MAKVMTVEKTWMKKHAEIFGMLRDVVNLADRAPPDRRAQMLEAAGEQLEGLRTQFDGWAKELA